MNDPARVDAAASLGEVGSSREPYGSQSPCELWRTVFPGIHGWVGVFSVEVCGKGVAEGPKCLQSDSQSWELFRGRAREGHTGAPGSGFRPLTTVSSLWSEWVRKLQ